MLRNLLKFAGTAIAIVVLGATVVFGIQYFRNKNSSEYQAVSYFKDLEKQYAEDPYGGSTPEETLQLFIDALKKGDTELAAKYFVIDKQAQWREDLARMEDKGLLAELIKEVEMTKLRVDGDTAYFTLNREDDLSSQLVMQKNSLNRRWKITEL